MGDRCELGALRTVDYTMDYTVDYTPLDCHRTNKHQANMPQIRFIKFDCLSASTAILIDTEIRFLNGFEMILTRAH